MTTGGSNGGPYAGQYKVDSRAVLTAMSYTAACAIRLKVFGAQNSTARKGG